MNGLLALLKDSVKTDSNISTMRILNYVTVLALLGTYAAQVVNMIVWCYTKGATPSIVDVPTVSASIIVGVLAVKVAQAFSPAEKQP